jgi:hypothetical protein
MYFLRLDTGPDYTTKPARIRRVIAAGYLSALLQLAQGRTRLQATLVTLDPLNTEENGLRA